MTKIGCCSRIDKSHVREAILAAKIKFNKNPHVNLIQRSPLPLAYVDSPEKLSYTVADVEHNETDFLHNTRPHSRD